MKPKHNGFIKIYLHKTPPCERKYDIITMHLASGVDTKDEDAYHMTPDEALEIATKLIDAVNLYLGTQNKEYHKLFIKPRITKEKK